MPFCVRAFYWGSSEHISSPVITCLTLDITYGVTRSGVERSTTQASDISRFVFFLNPTSKKEKKNQRLVRPLVEIK